MPCPPPSPDTSIRNNHSSLQECNFFSPFFFKEKNKLLLLFNVLCYCRVMKRECCLGTTVKVLEAVCFVSRREIHSCGTVKMSWRMPEDLLLCQSKGEQGEAHAVAWSD